MNGRATRWPAVGGIVGPASFIAAWSVLGLRTEGYSPIDDPISRLAAVGAETRPVMTAGLCILGAGLGVYAGSLRSALSGRAGVAAAATAAASFGIAALPLGSTVGGTPHAVAAGVAYATLAATPLLAAPTLAAEGRTGAARISVAAGVISALALTGSVVLGTKTGLLQRTGLTTGHLWIAASAAWLLRRR